MSLVSDVTLVGGREPWIWLPLTNFPIYITNICRSNLHKNTVSFFNATCFGGRSSSSENLYAHIQNSLQYTRNTIVIHDVVVVISADDLKI